MAKIVFKPTGNHPSLFSGNILDIKAENRPERLVGEAVDNLDISTITTRYQGGGTSSFHPSMMIKLLFYSYKSNR